MMSLLVQTILCLMFFACSLSAQVNIGQNSSHHPDYERITVDDGLPTNNIYALVQDRVGFLWIGTLYGLVRYDGYEYKTLYPEGKNAAGVRGKEIMAIQEGSDGALWLGTNSGLYKYSRESDTFTQIRGAAGKSDEDEIRSIRALYMDRQGNIWMARSGGIDKYSPVTNTVSGYLLEPLDKKNPANNEVRCISEDVDGAILAGTSAGLARLDTSTGRLARLSEQDYAKFPSMNRDIVQLLRDRKNSVWIGTHNGLYRYGPTPGAFEHFVTNQKTADQTSRREDAIDNVITVLSEDTNGTVWIGSATDGCFKYDGERDSLVRVTEAQAQNSGGRSWLTSMFVDRAEILWTGHWGSGVRKYDPFRHRFSDFGNSILGMLNIQDFSTSGFCEDSRGNIWIGTRGQGVLKYDPNRRTVRHYRHEPGNPASLSSDDVLCLFHDRSDRLWIGTYGGGLNRMLPEGSGGSAPVFWRYRSDPKDKSSLSSDNVQCIFEDAGGSIWLGTLGGGLNVLTSDESKRREPKFVRYGDGTNDSTSFNSLRVMAIYEDAKGDLWIGTDGEGLKKFNRAEKSFRSFYDKGSGFDYISCIHEDASGHLWVGTSMSGVYLFDGTSGEREAFGEEDGLASNVTRSMVEDRNGRLWIGTQRGLSRFSYERRSFRNYSISDGLPSNAFLPGAAYRDKEGRLYFGSLKSFAAFDPGSMVDNPHPPKIVITGIVVRYKSPKAPKEGARIGAGRDAQLIYARDDFMVEFTALHFGNPQNNRYSYFLENYDEGWLPATRERRASYTNLDAGEYIFHVRGSNSDGIWNEEGAMVRIIIIPPFWETWYFRGVLLLMIIGSSVTVYRRRIARLEQKRREVEGRLAERMEAEHKLQNAFEQIEHLKNRLEVENIYLQDEIKDYHNFENIVTQDPAFRKILRDVERVASTDATVLILGESGTGKELIARAIHNLSNRKGRSLLKVNCAALPASLIESELFGHEKGAFTGATAQKIGRFELADQGTIFLDEIGDLPLELQAKLLRILQDGEFERLGSAKTLRVNVRIIAATNRDLPSEVKTGNFREDLFYRLNVFPIVLAPLRERRDDIPLLAKHFIKRYSSKVGKEIKTVHPDFMKALVEYDWPGNVRELENCIERALIISQGDKLVLNDLPSRREGRGTRNGVLTLEEQEKEHICRILKMTNWQVFGEKGAARILGINPKTLYSRMKKLGIHQPKPKRGELD